MPTVDTTTLTDWRHQLHVLAETAFTEHQTAAFLAETLVGLGLEVATGIGGTGIVATLRRGAGQRSIGFRADMDALPLSENTGLPFTSRDAGTMHACGHDGHMTMLLGAAAELAADTTFSGTARFLFQPAEEPGQGATRMIESGIFDRYPVDALFGLHNIPGIAEGHFATRAGSLMAGEDNFTILLTGRGGHASAPHLVIDPIVVAAHVIVALQNIVARNFDALDAAVVSCTNITTDGARNAIPTHVTITGDTRNFTPEHSTQIEQRIRAIAEHTALAHGATAEVTYTREFLPTVNDQMTTDAAVAAAIAVAGAAKVTAQAPPNMASEDFGCYAHHVPTNFTFIGNGASGHHGGTPLHSHDYQFNDAILPLGVAYYLELARRHTRS